MVERVAVRPFFLGGSPAWLLSTIALGIIAENTAMLTFGKDARAFPSPLTQKPILVGGAGFYPQEVLIPLVGLALMALVQLLYHRSAWGKQLKGGGLERGGRRAHGHQCPARGDGRVRAVRPARRCRWRVLLAPLCSTSAPTMGTIIGLKAFAVAIIGGLGSAPGIVVAGLGYGLVESFVAGYLSTGAREIVGFGLVIAVLIVRPWGIGGARPARRV